MLVKSAYTLSKYSLLASISHNIRIIESSIAILSPASRLVGLWEEYVLLEKGGTGSFVRQVRCFSLCDTFGFFDFLNKIAT